MNATDDDDDEGALTSKWTGLHKSLLARIFSVKPNGLSDDGPVVVGPLTDTNVELTANWQSPFDCVRELQLRE